MNINRQSSYGSKSPNVNNSPGAQVTYNEANTAKLRSSNEVKAIMRLIELISHKIEKDTTQEYSIFVEKNINTKEKIEVRFARHKDELTKEFQELSILYGLNYDEAWKESSIDDNRADEIAVYLSRRSKLALAEQGEDPVSAINEMVSAFEGELENAQDVDKFSQGAIRYYLYRELMKCNVFPNLNNNAS